MKYAQVLRDAKAAYDEAKTYENAVEIQLAERNLQDQRKETIKLVDI